MASSRQIVFGILIVCALSSSVSAEGFGAKFRRFIIGDEPQEVAAKDAPELDAESKECLNCHDGSGGREIDVKSSTTPMNFVGHKTNVHPIGMNYKNHFRKTPSKLVPQEMLDATIQLVEGKVSCVSCHIKKPEEVIHEAEVVQKLLDKGPQCTASTKLAVSQNNRSELCLSCHNK